MSRLIHVAVDDDIDLHTSTAGIYFDVFGNVWQVLEGLPRNRVGIWVEEKN